MGFALVVRPLYARHLSQTPNQTPKSNASKNAKIDKAQKRAQKRMRLGLLRGN